MKKHTSPRVLLLAVLLIFSVNVQVAVAQTTLLEDDMSSPNYNSFSFDSFSNDEDASSESFAAGVGTGNPGGSLEITHSHDVEPGCKRGADQRGRKCVSSIRLY